MFVSNYQNVLDVKSVIERTRKMRNRLPIYTSKLLELRCLTEMN